MLKFCKILISIALVASAGCTKKTPLLEVEPEEVPGREKISIAYLKSLYMGRPYNIPDDFYIEGTVVSSDNGGNFYRTLVVEDDTGGIGIRIEMEPYFQHYRIGCRLSVNCNSLTLGAYGNLVQLGIRSDDSAYETLFIPARNLDSVITILDAEQTDPVPAELSISELSKRWLYCFVAFSGVQFIDEEIGMPWCDDQKDTDRHLTDGNGNILAVRTSGEVRYADYIIPDGSGYIEGILTYFNNRYQLVLNYLSDAIMNEPRF